MQFRSTIAGLAGGLALGLVVILVAHHVGSPAPGPATSSAAAPQQHAQDDHGHSHGDGGHSHGDHGHSHGDHGGGSEMGTLGPMDPAAAAHVEHLLAAREAPSEPAHFHELLHRFVGDWDATMTVYWAGPEGPSMVTHGRCRNEVILDGRYLEMRFRGARAMRDEHGGQQGVTFDGRGMLGYDNYRNLYVSTWADSMSTTIAVSRGPASFGPDGGLVLYGELDEPMLGLVGRTVKYAYSFPSDDHIRFEVHDLAIGEQSLVFSIDYRRRSSPE